MQLIELLENDKQQYNQFVANSPTGSFLQSWEWGEWQSALGRQVKRVKWEGESGEWLGACQLIQVPLPLGKCYWYAPFGPLWAESDKLQVTSCKFLLEALEGKLSDAIFLRIEPKNLALDPKPLALIKSKNIQPGKTLVIDLSKTEEQLLAEMHPKTRYNIKLAQKHGVEVQKDLAITPAHGLYFKEVVEQITQTEKRQGFVGHGQMYYQGLIDFFALKPQSEIKVSVYKALYQKQLLASAVMVDFSAKGYELARPKVGLSPTIAEHHDLGSASGGGTRTYLFGGSAEANKNVMAPYLLHFIAMTDAKAAGIKFYDFWGLQTSGGKVPGFARFKLGFGGEEKIFAGAWDLVIKPAQYRLYQTLHFCRRLFRG